jgi:uncharacterized RDD family membrane protein YckC
MALRRQLTAEEKLDTTIRRAGAYLLDLLVVFLIALLAGSSGSDTPATRASFPVAIVAAIYLLIKDVVGASPGKLALGLHVTGVAGGATDIKQRLIRNIPLALAPGLSAFTPAGSTIGTIAGIAGGLIFLADAAFVFDGGQRFGDRMAETAVYRKTAV